MQNSDLLLYEFPCSEKNRFFLRFESLAKRFDWYCSQDCAIAHQAAIGTIFDLADVAARSDLRNDLVQELLRQKCALEARCREKGSPDENLSELLQEVSSVSREVSQVVGRSGQSIRDNEWLQLIRTRQHLPGGTCEFDMPQLHYWLSRPPEERRKELLSLTESLAPTIRAVSLILRLMRSSTRVTNEKAVNGMLQLSVTGKNYSLARVWLPQEAKLIPEVSANKYMLWIRFSLPDERHKLHAVHETIPFLLGLCQ